MSWILPALLLLPPVALAALHLGFRAPRRRERGAPAAVGMRFREVTIPPVRDLPLRGWRIEPRHGGSDDAPTVVIVMAGGPTWS